MSNPSRIVYVWHKYRWILNPSIHVAFWRHAPANPWSVNDQEIHNSQNKRFDQIFFLFTFLVQKRLSTLPSHHEVYHPCPPPLVSLLAVTLFLCGDEFEKTMMIRRAECHFDLLQWKPSFLWRGSRLLTTDPSLYKVDSCFRMVEPECFVLLFKVAKHIL
jgi:hypothetical protein